jgi:predicted DNA-binding transcriptional regulator AlpA
MLGNDHLKKVPMAMSDSNQLSVHQQNASQVALPKPNRLIDFNKAQDRSGFSRSHLYEQIALNKFPRPIKMGTGRRGAIRFVEAEVDSWVQAKIESREGNK